MSDVDKFLSVPGGASVIPGRTTLSAGLVSARNDIICAQMPYGPYFLDLAGYHQSPTDTNYGPAGSGQAVVSRTPATGATCIV